MPAFGVLTVFSDSEVFISLFGARGEASVPAAPAVLENNARFAVGVAPIDLEVAACLGSEPGNDLAGK